MSTTRLKIVSRKFPHTGKRRWLLKAIVPHGASTLTSRPTFAEAVEAMNTLTR